MNCENVFCIYESDGQCISENVELDFGGRCKNCILPDISEIILESKKNKVRQELSENSQGIILKKP